MMRITLYLYLTLIIAACGNAKTDLPVANAELPVARAEDAGLNTDSLNRLAPYMQQFIDSSYIAGGVVLVSRNNKVVYNEAFGHFDRKKTQTLKTDDIFRIASMTKPIVTVAAMQLYEQGKLDVHDPVSKYIPAFKNPVIVENFSEKDSSYTTRPAKNEITIHHLLTHTSGLAYGVFHPVAGPVYAKFGAVEAWSKDSLTLAMNVPKMGQLPLLHEPGAQFTYGVSTEVLAYIVELVSGMPLDTYFKENIFDPLGMEDTHFYLPAEKAERLVEVWYRGDFTPLTFPESFRDDYPISGRKMYFSGGGGLSSTATDYVKFASALLKKGSFGDTQILKPKTVKLMMTNQIDSLYVEEGMVQFGYGASLFTKDGPYGRKAGRYSWGGFWQTNFWIDPARDMVVVVMTNAFDTPRYGPFFDGIEEIINNAVREEI